MSKLKVTFDTKTITVPNESCCADGITCLVNISGTIPGHRYYCELASISGGTVTFAQNNFYIVAQSSSSVIPLGFGLKNTRSYIIKFKITDIDTRKSYKYWIPSKDEWHKSAYYDPTLNNNSGGYWRYAMMTDTTPVTQNCDIDGKGLANVGSIGFASQGSVSTDTGNINTATTFSAALPGIVSTSYKNGYFIDLPSNIYISDSWFISLATNQGSSVSSGILQFTHPVLGSFDASSAHTTLNTSFTSSSGDISRRRILYLKGSFLEGSLGALSSNGVPAILIIELSQYGSVISLSGTLSLSSNSANYNGAADWNTVDGNLTTVGTNGGPSYYGTYDQNGNINQWIDDITTKSKQYTGGFWDSSSYEFRKIIDSPIRSESANIGFRTAAAMDRDLDIDVSKYIAVDQSSTSPNVKDSNGLGSVSYPFYMQKYPVTNSEYVVFLNTVAQKSDNYGLYNSKMTTDIRGGIIRSLDENKFFVYSCKENMDNKPVNFVNWFDAARYCNWLHNLSFDKQSTNTETGAYDLTDNNQNMAAPYSGFAYSEDIVTIQCGEISGHSVAFSDDTIKLSKSFGCNKPRSIVATMTGAIIGRPYSYTFSSTDGLFAGIFPISGTIVAGDINQNINTVYAYDGSLKKVELRLEVTDLVDNITGSDSIILNCEDCTLIPTPTPTPK